MPDDAIDDGVKDIDVPRSDHVAGLGSVLVLVGWALLFVTGHVDVASIETGIVVTALGVLGIYDYVDDLRRAGRLAVDLLEE